MGIGGKIKSAGRKLDSKVRSVAARPLSRDSLETVAPLIAGVPLPTSDTTKILGVDSVDKKNGGYGEQQKKLVSRDGSSFLTRLVYPDNKELKQTGETATAAAVLGGAIVVCIYASTFCAPAMTYALGYSGVLNGLNALQRNKYASAANAGDDGLAENIPSDSGPGGLGEEFSLDPSTANGKRNLTILAAVGGAVALYFTIRYVRK